MPTEKPAARQIVEVTKPGNFDLKIGDSLRKRHDGTVFSSVKYNFKPQASLANAIPPHLSKNGTTGEAPYTLTVTPTNVPSPNPITYDGAQHIPKETECILLYDQETQSFTLERLSSAFTFNAKVFASAHPPLPLRPPVLGGEDDEISAEEKEEDNPFDFRHFLNKRATTKTRAEQRAEKEQRRKKALIAAGALSESPEGSEAERGAKDEEGGLGLGISHVGRPPIIARGGKSGGHAPSTKRGGTNSASGAGKKQASAGRGVDSSGPGHGYRGAMAVSSEDSEADNEDNDEGDDDDGGGPPTQTRGAHQRRAEEDGDIMDFPSIPSPHAAEEDEEEISDVDESDDEQKPPPVIAQQRPVPTQEAGEEEGEEDEDEEDDEDDGFDLAEELEQALEEEGDTLMASSNPHAEGEIIIEDDDSTAIKPRFGTINRSTVPMSLSRMAGGVSDESESESSEEE